MYQCWKLEGAFVNASDRPACQTITDRGIAMIPLPRWGRTLDWRMNKKKNTGGNRGLPTRFGVVSLKHGTRDPQWGLKRRKCFTFSHSLDSEVRRVLTTTSNVGNAIQVQGTRITKRDPVVVCSISRHFAIGLFILFFKDEGGGVQGGG